MHKCPLLLEQLLQFGICGLRVLVGNPCKGLHGIRPPRDFSGQPPLLCLPIPYKSTKVSVPCHHLNSHPLKELLRPGYILQVHDQDVFGRL